MVVFVKTCQESVAGKKILFPNQNPVGYFRLATEYPPLGGGDCQAKTRANIASWLGNWHFLVAKRIFS